MSSTTVFFSKILIIQEHWCNYPPCGYTRKRDCEMETGTQEVLWRGPRSNLGAEEMQSQQRPWPLQWGLWSWPHPFRIVTGLCEKAQLISPTFTSHWYLATDRYPLPEQGMTSGKAAVLPQSGVLFRNILSGHPTPRWKSLRVTSNQSTTLSQSLVLYNTFLKHLHPLPPRITKES